MGKSTSKKNKPPLLGIDLFSGCGGLSVGMKDAGVKVVAAVEIDKLAAQTYRANHPDVHLFESDITKLTGKLILEKLKLNVGDIDVLAGCPPCQGFSSIRTKNSGKAVKDKRNDLIFDFLRLIDELQPKSVMLENVPGLEKDKRFKKFIKKLTELNYIGETAVLDVSKYGVPQRRRRLIYIASKGVKPSLATPESSVTVTVKDAIYGLAVPGKSGDLLHDLEKNHTQQVMSLIKAIPKNGGSRSSLPKSMQLKCHQNFGGFNDVYGRMAWDYVSPTITSGCNNPSKGRFLHPEQDRVITLREASILQGFPPSYKFPNLSNKAAIALMIGNAMPPPFVSAHTKSLLKTIKKITLSE